MEGDRIYIRFTTLFLAVFLFVEPVWAEFLGLVCGPGGSRERECGEDMVKRIVRWGEHFAIGSRYFFLQSKS